MTIVDGHYGGEIVSSHGKVYPFDSIDCLVKFHKSHQDDGAKIFLFDFLDPGKLIPASEARIATLDAQLGPMGSRFIAMRADDRIGEELSGKVSSTQSWDESFKN